MNSQREEPFDRDQPTLIVTYGNTTRKHRALDREVIVLGRAPACDLPLQADEVAPLHCVLVRCPGGWRVRNFSGRIGTLLNGRPIHDAVIGHDDVLQIGSFSFRLHVPPPFRRPDLGPVEVTPETAEVRHLRRSRRNLARLALNLRRGYHDSAAALERAERLLDQHQQDLDELRETARARQQALEQQKAALAERLRAAEEELKRVRTERLFTTANPGEVACSLEQRGRELTHFAQHLRRKARRLAEAEEELRQRGEGARPRPAAISETPRSALARNLRERLAKVEQLKNGLAGLRSGDSAPGVTQRPVPARRTSDGADSVHDTPL